MGLQLCMENKTTLRLIYPQWQGGGTIGGECSVSVVPFTYLADKYADDVAVVWIDAHPDLNLPYEGHKGYHAMALTAVMGKGDKEIMKLLPAKIDAPKVLIGTLPTK